MAANLGDLEVKIKANTDGIKSDLNKIGSQNITITAKVNGDTTTLDKKIEDEKKKKPEIKASITAKDETGQGIIEARNSVNKAEHGKLGIDGDNQTTGGITSAQDSIAKADHGKLGIDGLDTTDAGITEAQSSVAKATHGQLGIDGLDTTGDGITAAQNSIAKAEHGKLGIDGLNTTGDGITDAQTAVAKAEHGKLGIDGLNNTGDGITEAQTAVKDATHGKLGIDGDNQTTDGITAAQNSVAKAKHGQLGIDGSDNTGDGITDAQDSVAKAKHGQLGIDAFDDTSGELDKIRTTITNSAHGELKVDAFDDTSGELATIRTTIADSAHGELKVDAFDDTSEELDGIRTTINNSTHGKLKVDAQNDTSEELDEIRTNIASDNNAAKIKVDGFIIEDAINKLKESIKSTPFVANIMFVGKILGNVLQLAGKAANTAIETGNQVQDNYNKSQELGMTYNDYVAFTNTATALGLGDRIGNVTGFSKQLQSTFTGFMNSSWQNWENSDMKTLLRKMGYIPEELHSGNVMAAITAKGGFTQLAFDIMDYFSKQDKGEWDTLAAKYNFSDYQALQGFMTAMQEGTWSEYYSEFKEMAGVGIDDEDVETYNALAAAYDKMQTSLTTFKEVVLALAAPVVEKAMNSISTIITDIIKILKDDTLTDEEKGQQIWTTIKDQFSGFFSFLEEWGKKFGEKIKSLWDVLSSAVAQGVSYLITRISENLSPAWKKILGLQTVSEDVAYDLLLKDDNGWYRETSEMFGPGANKETQTEAVNAFIEGLEKQLGFGLNKDAAFEYIMGLLSQEGADEFHVIKALTATNWTEFADIMKQLTSDTEEDDDDSPKTKNKTKSGSGKDKSSGKKVDDSAFSDDVSTSLSAAAESLSSAVNNLVNAELSVNCDVNTTVDVRVSATEGLGAEVTNYETTTSYNQEGASAITGKGTIKHIKRANGRR